MFLLKDTTVTPVRLKTTAPWLRVKHSTTERLCSGYCLCLVFTYYCHLLITIANSNSDSIIENFSKKLFPKKNQQMTVTQEANSLQVIHINPFASMEIFLAFLPSADIFQIIFSFGNSLSGIPSGCQTVWTQIRHDIFT